jgi:hypothetical protein
MLRSVSHRGDRGGPTILGGLRFEWREERGKGDLGNALAGPVRDLMHSRPPRAAAQGWAAVAMRSRHLARILAARSRRNGTWPDAIPPYLMCRLHAGASLVNSVSGVRGVTILLASRFAADVSAHLAAALASTSQRERGGFAHRARTESIPNLATSTSLLCPYRSTQFATRRHLARLLVGPGPVRQRTVKRLCH